MDVTAVVLVVAQWLHTLAAAFWVGGGAVYLLVIRPMSRRAPSTGSGQASTGSGQTLAEEFRGLVDIAVIAMVITGVVLAFDRLTSQHTGAGYAAVLGVKLALTLWMFWLAGVMRRRRPRAAAPSESSDAGAATTGWRRLMDSTNQVVAIGVAVFLLSTVMQWLFERAVQ